jgi:uroporphyrinogen-III synthase
MVAREMAGAALPLLYLAGEERSVDLAEQLAPHGLTVRTTVVYRAAAAQRLPPKTERAISAGELEGVLHYSRRSAATLLALARQSGGAAAWTEIAHYCLSAEVAAPLREAGAARIAVAARPDEASLLALIPR